MVDIILVQISTSYITWETRSNEPQLGQYYIAEYAYQHGYNLKIKKYSSNDLIVNSLSSLLKDLECSCVGFYVDSENIWTIRRIIFDLKENIPNLIAYLGGPQVTGNPQNALKLVPDADFAMVGEGEITTTELLDAKLNFKSQKIYGIAYIDENGEYHYSGNRPQSRNLDNYPYPIRERYTLDKDIKFMQILTGRGCIGKCAFCFEGSKKNNILRMRSVCNVCEELEYLISRLPANSYITFLDDTFIINPERTRQICNWMIEKYNGDVKWFCEARVDILIKNLDLLPLMKKAGLVRIQLGGESGSQKVLDAYNKGMKIEDLKIVVRGIYDAGIDSVYVNYILGGAFETLETFNQTVELAKELLEIAPGCAEVGSSLFTPYVGSPMYSEPQKYGLTIIDRDLVTGPDGYTPFVTTDELSAPKVMQLKNIFDNQVNDKSKEIIPTLSYECMKRHYELAYKYSVATFWHDRIELIESLNRYFGAIFLPTFVSIKALTLDTVQNALPYRTEQPISDGEHYFRRICGKTIIKNTDIENAVLLLSAGKLAFWEIVHIIGKNQKFKHIQNIETTIWELYQQFDKEYMIVWKVIN